MNTLKLNLMEQGRATEWLTSITLLVFSVILALPGETLARPAYHALTSIGLDDASLAVPLALIAGARMAALYVNGHWKRSPLLRQAGAITGAAVFATVAAALLWPILEDRSLAVSTGFGTYLVLALFDALAAYRSGADARLAQQLHGQPR